MKSLLRPFKCVTIHDEPGVVFIKRYYILKTKFLSIYVHNITADDDVDMHDHPWPFLILILAQGYREVIEKSRPMNFGEGPTVFQTYILRKRFDIFGHLPSFKHRIELIDNKPSWSLVVMGPKVREWGFHTEAGWVHFKKYTSKLFRKGCQ